MDSLLDLEIDLLLTIHSLSATVLESCLDRRSGDGILIF